MTDIVRAKNSGFCFGVRQAIEKTEEQIEKNKDGRRIYTFGPLIHNRLVTDGLRACLLYTSGLSQCSPLWRSSLSPY